MSSTLRTAVVFSTIVSTSAALTVLSACRREPTKDSEPAKLGVQAKPKKVTSQPVVASLHQPKADVSFRKAHELLWQSAADGLGLANYDRVKTGTGSSSLIRYSDDTELVVGESTLVIIVDRTEKERQAQSVVALPAGEIDASIIGYEGHEGQEKKEVELVIRTSRGWIHASNRDQKSGKEGRARFKASISPKGDLKIKSESGQIRVLSKGGERIIREKETLTLVAPPGSVALPEGEISEASFDELPEASQASAPPVAPETFEATPIPDVFQILEPKKRATVTTGMITVRGKISGRMKASVNGIPIKADANDRFLTKVPLEPGINMLTFQIVGPSASRIRYETREVIRK